MSSCSNAQTTKVGHLRHHNACSSVRNLSECHEGPSRPDEDEDEDEDEDVDFNPFLKETLSPEASSSLSSEVEGLDGDAVDSGIVGVSSSKVASDLQKCERFGEEVVTQTTVSSEGICEKEFQKVVERSPMKRTSTLFSQPGSETIQEKDNFLGNGTDVNDVMEGELVNTTDSQKPVIDLGTEDAICTRTRARYSLASFSLDELETFLQETDDEDDLQNVDDEEEYRKFLAAVLQGGDEEDGHSTQGNEIADDDEDNDADFEIELEEALESDIDENTRDKTERKYEKGGRRPETRQNRRQKTNVRCKKKLSTQTERPLRPLLPVLPNVPVSSFSTRNRKMADVALSCPSFPRQNGYANGFTQQQIGQLHCLIHEHVQLLIQVFSLCVRDSSRQHIASQVQKMILEMLHKRNEVQAWKTVSYPATCFCPPYLCSSVPYDVPKLMPVQCSLDSSPSNATDEMCSQNNQTAASQNVHLSKARFERASNGQAGTFPNLEGLFWVPYVSGPIVTVLDVAPLRLVEKFMNDVETAFQEGRRRHVETSCDSRFEKEALFSLPVFPLVAQANSEVLSRSTAAINTASSSPSQQPRKKTLAATIVESTKKQSVALVPKDIAKLSQRFLPLFNPALFPHKPPSAAVSNRVLFIDSEDELLALGMMEYNTDWKAIQQRFLPCIQEGLKVYKYDWMSVCQFIVPHRDPSLLPRQWRMAHGTQKSYKLDAEKKEKRRLYELNKRKCKSAASATWQNKEDSQFENSGGDNNNADGCIDNAGKIYVHEAFLADWTPGDSGGYSCSDIARNPQSVMLSQEAAQEQLPNYSRGKAPQPQAGTIHEFPSMYNHPPLHFAGVRHSGASTTEENSSISNMTLNTSRSQFYFQPYRARRSNGTHLVKLAPDLPPVNLPPSVRVVSQSSFRGSLHGAPASLSAAGGGTFAAEKDNLMSQIPHAGRLGIPNLTKARENMSNNPSDCRTSFHTEESRIVEDKCVEDERSNDSDLQMHPLLFQAPDGGRLPYYPLNCSTSNSSSFSFFPGNQPQLNLSLLHNPHQENHVGCFSRLGKFKESPSLSHSIDFHPLLQRTDYLHSDSISSGGKYMQLQYPLDAVETEPLVNTDPLATHRLIEKANELDLEIHLSSTSRKEGSWGGGAMTHNSVKSTTNAPDSGFTVRTQNSNRSSYQHTENSSSRSSKSILAGHSSVVPDNNIDGYVDDMGDQSHPEIVMEQEELSDSDEENEENVEFECEEMTDSEGDEGSGCEEITEMQNEEVPSLAMEKLTSADCDHNNCEPRTKFHSQGNLRSPGKNIPSLDLGLTSQGNDDTSRSSWLSLDSGTPHSLADVKNGHESTEIRENIATKSLSSSRPGRSCKKRNPKEDMEHKQTIDGKQQAVSLASLRIPILRKSRKRARGTDPSLNIEMNVRKTNCDGEDKVS